MTNSYTLSLANDKIWNIPELINFLVENQGKEIELTVNPEAHCLRASGLYDLVEKFKFSKVTIHTFNALETHPYYTIKHYSVDVFFKAWNKYDLTSSGIWNKAKIFGVFYGRPTASRIGIASHLFVNHKDISEIRIVTNIDSADNRILFELEKLFEYDSASIYKFSKLIEKFSFQEIDYTPMGHLLNYTSPLHRLYENILIDIISEPNIKGDTFFPTEKVVRPMLLKKPFIAMASKNYLDHLHQMGFYTFNEFWDEDYDGFESRDRYLKILKLIDDLTAKTTGELNQMYCSMKSRLDYNYNLIVNSMYKTKITKIV
jgi:hypothetical protein